MTWVVNNAAQEKAGRVRTAIKLGRQEFWKNVYTAAVAAGQTSLEAEEKANRALLDFDMKFKDTPS